MLMFYTETSKLPEDPAKYFSHYHNLWFTPHPKATTKDLESALSELRLAYKKYPNRRWRIKEMADIIQTGINKFTKKEYKNPPPRNFKEQVVESLF